MKKALALSKRSVANELCDLSALPKDARERILIIARGGYETWQSINIMKDGPDRVKNFVDFEGGLRTKDGDGRVPHVSSCCYFDKVQTLMLEDAFWYKDYSHGFVLKDERVQKLVNRFIFGKKRFNYRIPGGSIQQVTGLDRIVDDDTSLPKWIVKYN
jgi:hypothetical protein